MTEQRNPKHPSFAEVKAASLQAIERVLAHWLPGGKRVDGGKEYTAPNPLRADKHTGSLKVNLARGTWADFATGDKGGDLIDLVQYLERCTQVEACNKLADFLDVTAGASPVPAGTGKAKAPAWVPVLPIPAEAMARVYKEHRQHGRPSKVWVYRDAEGRPLMVLYRFDKAPDAEGKRAKVFAPLTWCRNAAGAHQWRWSGLPEPRPLLHLEELAQRPDAPVVVCEGEKSADAAAELLPDHVATCWPNGAQSWHKADFAPLAKRNVLLWPDNDENGNGQACMAAVAKHLHELGAASVQTMALNVFAQHPVVVDGAPAFEPGGKWEDGDDAADALAKGWTAAHLAALAQSGELYALAPAAATERHGHDDHTPAPAKAASKPASRSKRQPASTQGNAADSASGDQQSGFKVTDAGVFYYGDDGAPVPVCSRLYILARTRDDKGHNWGLMVEFDDPDGVRKRLNIPASAMAGEFGKEVVGPLVSMGLRLAQGRRARNCKDNLQSYLQAYDSPERARLVNRLGWHGDAYLLPDEQLGSQAEHLHFYEAGAALPPIEQAGTLEQWQDGVARYCVGNNRLAFVLSTAFAGPLLHLLGAESGGFHLYGDSSGGKTTHLKAAASVYGGPRMVRTWRSTDNAMEFIAAAHSDGFLALDEIHQCDSRIVGETVYMLGNGSGKERRTDKGGLSNLQLWRLLFLSTGEKTLGQHMAEGGKELKAGMEVRMVGIPADAGKGLGLFETLHGFLDGAALAETLTSNASKLYGTALVTFLRAMLDSKPLPKLAEDLARVADYITAQLLPSDAGGQARRVAARFALVAAAGELATRLGVTGWPEHTAWQAARVCFKAWLDARGGAGNLEEDAIVNHLRTLIELHGEARFTRWENVDATTDPHAPRTVNRLGFRRSHERDPGDGQPAALVLSYYVLGGVWASEIWKGYNVANVNKVLLARGILTPGSNGSASRSERLPGMGKTRCYLVNPAALFADQQPEQLANAA